ncbi:MAG: type II toxin-antitoxin system PemK/MazF family toxin [Alphaproteobacteria bacterium]|nr:type II toxin-antitoxin system PemK/MazF family toxin [Alphaproteobacteria bacterium]
MKRGDIVLCNLSGDYGKTRPAVVVQSDIFNPTHASVVVCPVTSFLVDSPLFRLEMSPNKKNGLLKKSQIMVDKIIAIKRDKVCEKVGVISHKEQDHLDNAIKLWLSIEN